MAAGEGVSFLSIDEKKVKEKQSIRVMPPPRATGFTRDNGVGRNG